MREYYGEVSDAENWERQHRVITVEAESVRDAYKLILDKKGKDEDIYQISRDFDDCNCSQPVYDFSNGFTFEKSEATSKNWVGPKPVEDPINSTLCDRKCGVCPILIHPNFRMLSVLFNSIFIRFGDEVLKMVEHLCPNLTVCPDCGVDDFCHNEGCTVEEKAIEL